MLRTLDDFFAPYPEIEVLFEGYEVIATGPTWQARVRGENLILTGPENLDEGTFAGSGGRSRGLARRLRRLVGSQPRAGRRARHEGSSRCLNRTEL